MKSAPWMAVVLLALMVGGITFVVVYLNSEPPDRGQQSGTPASLTFLAKQFPQKGDRLMATEVDQTGHQDFWFYNDSGQDVPVGLTKKGCSCSEVALSIAPPSWAPRLRDESAALLLQRVAALSPRVPDGLSELAAAYSLECAAPQLPEEEAQTTLLTRDNSVVVAAGAFGWVRLSWQRHTPEMGSNFSANLWMSQRGDSNGATLEAAAMIVKPVNVMSDMTVGPFSLRELEKEQTTWVYCWSLTRPSFHIKTEAVHPHGKAESDPVEIGQPVALDSAELQRMEKMSEEKQRPMQFLSGYRIPVTVRGRAKDGTPIEWGHFRRTIKVTSEDPGIEPMQVKVTGEVHGDVRLGSGKDSSLINFGPFVRSRGARGEIVLQTDSPSIDLELDAAHVPEYLQVQFPDRPEETPGGHRIWVVQVKVKPNAARGDFPRADDPIYHDSAIYVKTKEKPPRTIRIPVMGTAND